MGLATRIALIFAAVLAGIAPAAAQENQTASDAPRPNIVLVLLDDVGFGAAATFGGPAETPALSTLAADGLRYNRFHTTAICSPTRASLLTGRNPHAAGIGAVMNAADGRPGYSGVQTDATATIAEVLSDNGYATGAFGKWHQVPDWEASQAGPFDRWPTGEGFDKFYGFLGGETDQFEPTLYSGTTPIMRPAGNSYHVTEDMAAQAISWMRTVRASAPDKPFLLYFSTGGIHAPVQVPQAYIDRYRGQFDGGWDAMRQTIFERQKRLGVIPADAELTPRPDELPAWDTLSAEQQRFAARLMEAYAGFLTHTDEQVAKLIAELKARGEYENTMFVYVVGDNGGSAEGGLLGSLNYLGQLTGMPAPQAAKLARIAEVGGRSAHAHVNSAWAWATNAPFQWAKTVASHLGGTRNPLVISWPAGIADAGGLRSQFGHVNDIVPTIYDLLHIDPPAQYNGVAQKPIDGTSLAYSFANADAPERHTTQYFEVFGHRAIYREGWMASAFHGRLPWTAFAPPRDFDDDVWELYDLRNDFSQANDLADQRPDKLAELKALFMAEAERNDVLPLSGQVLADRGLPDAGAGSARRTYYPGAIGIAETAVPRLAGGSWTMSADIDAGKDARGVIAAMGGEHAGLALYFDETGAPTLRMRVFDVKTALLKGAGPLASGSHRIVARFVADKQAVATGGRLSLEVDGTEVATETLPATPAAFFSINENFGLGLDTGSPAGEYPADAQPGYPLRDAKIRNVTVDATR